MLPIIEAIQDEDDRNYVGEVYEAHFKKLIVVAEHYLKNKEDSEDCIQDMVPVLIEQLQSFREWSEFHQKNFLMKVCRCIAINKYNARMKREVMEISLEELYYVQSSEDLAELIVSEERLQGLCELIDTMDPAYADIVYLRIFADMKNSEIAEMTGMRVDLVATRYSRALAWLKTRKGDEIHEITRR